MERLYKGFEIITNRVHTSNQQRQILIPHSLRCTQTSKNLIHIYFYFVGCVIALL